MIVNSGLGNTLTDISDDITASNYTGIAGSLITGLANGDGWAYMLSLSLAFLGYKLYSGVKSAPGRYQANRVASTRKQISKLESKISGIRRKVPKGRDKDVD